MELSSPRFKAIAVTVGFSFWFYIATSTLKIFSIDVFVSFVIIVIITTQIFVKKISKGLDIFAVVNTKIFLGMLFIFVIFFYGIFFKLLKIDLLRLQRKSTTYWQEMEHLKQDRLFKQY